MLTALVDELLGMPPRSEACRDFTARSRLGIAHLEQTR